MSTSRDGETMDPPIPHIYSILRGNKYPTLRVTVKNSLACSF